MSEAKLPARGTREKVEEVEYDGRNTWHIWRLIRDGRLFHLGYPHDSLAAARRTVSEWWAHNATTMQKEETIHFEVFRQSVRRYNKLEIVFKMDDKEGQRKIGP